MITVTNLTRQTVVGNKVKVAKGFWARLKGLIGTPELKPGEGLMLPHCMGIHMIGMGYALDVLYLDKNNQVILALENIKPNQFGPTKMNSAAVLEFPVGTINSSRTVLGDQLALDGAELVEPVRGFRIPAFQFI